MTTFEDAPRDPVDELGILLARYADTVLKPDPFAMDRVRAELRARAQRASVHRRAEALAAAAVPARVAQARRGPFTGWSFRRASFAAAASLVLGVSVASTTFAASRAGGPLYEPRIWIETATLPREAGPRLQAELAFAETRLAEASAAATEGDSNGVTAALDAFTVMVAMTSDEQAHGSSQAVAIPAFQHHLQVLQGLVATVPAAAQGALTRAMSESGKATKTLETAPGRPADPGKGGGGGQGGSGGQSGSGGSGGSGGQGGSGENPGQGGSNGGGVPGVPANDPDATPKPGKSSPPADPAPTPSHGNGGSGNQGGGSIGGTGGDGGGGNAGGAHSPPPDDPPANGHVPKDPPRQERTPKP